MFYGDLFMKKYLINYFIENKKGLKVLLMFMLLGIIIGIFIYQIISIDIKNEIIDSCKSTLNLSKENNYNKINIIMNGCITNIILLIVIYLSSLMIIGPPLTSFIGTLKGVGISFYACTLISVFGIKEGIISILCLIIVTNIIYIPILVYTLMNAINFHYIITNKTVALSSLIREIYNVIISISIMFLSVIVEQIMCNVVINIWKNL